MDTLNARFMATYDSASSGVLSGTPQGPSAGAAATRAPAPAAAVSSPMNARTLAAISSGRRCSAMSLRAVAAGSSSSDKKHVHAARGDQSGVGA